MKHTIEGIEVEIEWEQEFMIENHGSGDEEWAVIGEGDDGRMYYGDGNYQHGELIDVIEIEKL